MDRWGQYVPQIHNKFLFYGFILTLCQVVGWLVCGVIVVILRKYFIFFMILNLRVYAGGFMMFVAVIFDLSILLCRQ